jgi:hypothetical protein
VRTGSFLLIFHVSYVTFSNVPKKLVPQHGSLSFLLLNCVLFQGTGQIGTRILMRVGNPLVVLCSILVLMDYLFGHVIVAIDIETNKSFNP